MIKGRILVVDDDWFARELYAEYLLQDGHVVEAAVDGQEALDAMHRHGFDLVITDLVLPRMSGQDLLEEVKRTWPDMAVIVIASLNSVDPAVRALKAGAFDYLVKPLNPDALKLAVHRCLETRRLLRENTELKSHVDLFSACQRISSCLDAERIHDLATEAFATALGADSAVYVQEIEGTHDLEAKARFGVSREAASMLATLLAARVKDLLEGQSRAPIVERLNLGVKDKQSELYTLQYGLFVPLGEGGKRHGCVLLCRRAGKVNFSPKNISDAVFISKNVISAWENIQHYVSARNLAFIDDLTGLYNYRYMEHVIDREIREHDYPFSLLFMDLDHFKYVNDEHGHLVGSRLLVETARVIKRCVRDFDVVSRYGGDEYCVILRRTDSGEALKVGERIRRSIAGHQFLAREGLKLHITTCIGVATYPEHAKSKKEVIDLADMAMYRGKHTTRNVIYVATPAAPAAAAEKPLPAAEPAQEPPAADPAEEPPASPETAEAGKPKPQE
ncbi:MAG: diguanylate cyclase [Deltaproteobacteria bacterium]|nr:diguanylate cyclase [Deltaproteobacteria bacterium]